MQWHDMAMLQCAILQRGTAALVHTWHDSSCQRWRIYHVCIGSHFYMRWEGAAARFEFANSVTPPCAVTDR